MLGTTCNSPICASSNSSRVMVYLVQNSVFSEVPRGFRRWLRLLAVTFPHPPWNLQGVLRYSMVSDLHSSGVNVGPVLCFVGFWFLSPSHVFSGVVLESHFAHLGEGEPYL